MMFMRVLLPEPDWPMMATNSPRAISSDTPPSAKNAAPPAV